MSEPIGNDMLAKMKHREYEAKASHYWGYNSSTRGESGLSHGAVRVRSWVAAVARRIACGKTQLDLSPVVCLGCGKTRTLGRGGRDAWHTVELHVPRNRVRCNRALMWLLHDLRRRTGVGAAWMCGEAK
jgi:hypothetical protein